MVKLLLAAAVVVGIIIGAAHFSTTHSAKGPVPAGPVTIQGTMPNPLGGN